MKESGRPRGLVAEEALLQTPLGRTLADRLPVVAIRPRIEPADYAAHEAGELILASHRGSFVKPCPGTRGYVCCGLQIIHFGLGCYLDCSYCILQSYLGTEALVLFGNTDRGLAEVREYLRQPLPRPMRFCTGEFTDSLLLEGLTGFGRRLVEIFADCDHAVLELKTKTTNVSGLLDLEHAGRTIVSFSVNAPMVARQEESKAATLDRRLEAAARVVQKGYRVGFHFDPLIRHPGWREGYGRTVEDIFEAVPADRIAWISLGAFRYLPRFKTIIKRRHPKSLITEEEFILAPDGKMRYLRPRRVEMYRHLLSTIRQAAPKVCVYLCMESPRVWREVFGFDPGPDGLIHMLDQQVEDPRGRST